VRPRESGCVCVRENISGEKGKMLVRVGVFVVSAKDYWISHCAT